jgi:hypothetical protein
MLHAVDVAKSVVWLQELFAFPVQLHGLFMIAFYSQSAVESLFAPSPAPHAVSGDWRAGP